MYVTKRSGTEDLEWAIGLNRFALKCAGLWPDTNQSRRQKFLSNMRALVIFTMILFILIIPGYMSLIKVFDDMRLVIDNLQLTFPLTIVAGKIGIIWWKNDVLASVVSMIIHDWTELKTHSQRVIMIKQAKRARYIIIFGYVIMLISSAVLLVPPLFGYTMRYVSNITDPGRLLISQSSYPFDVTKSPSYELVFVGQAVAITVAAISFTGIDNFLGLSVFHICAQIEMVAQQFTNFGRSNHFQTTLAINVRHHLRLIRSIDIIESTYNLLLLGLLFFFVVMFCLLGYLAVTVINNADKFSTTRLMWVLSIIINLFVHMAIYCIVGEILIFHSGTIYRAVYDNEWYLLKPVDTKCLLVIMLCSKRPLYISAGKMFPMTMATFCNLIKTSAGYMSVLVALQA